jgi:hypothetical protein
MRSAVRVATAWVVSVGFGPPSALASAELSPTNSRSTQRASAYSSSTESSALTPMRIVECTWSGTGGKSIRSTVLAPAARRISAARLARNSRLRWVRAVRRRCSKTTLGTGRPALPSHAPVGPRPLS